MRHRHHRCSRRVSDKNAAAAGKTCNRTWKARLRECTLPALPLSTHAYDRTVDPSAGPVSPFAILLVGIAMSTDAFAAAVARGVSLRAPTFRAALQVALVFAAVETLMPALGWMLGRAASGVVEGWDHWIALALLGGLGTHMIIEGLRPRTDDQVAPFASIWRTTIAAVATSIDALAAGVGLAFLDASVVVVSLTIGVCTLLMVTLGILVGARFGNVLGKRAEVFGGAVLIAMGVGIAYQHTVA